MKIAVIYTGVTPELTRMVDEDLRRNFKGMEIEIMNYQDSTIINEAREHGFVTKQCVRRLVDLYERGVKDGANILLNACSSVGDVAKLCKPIYAMMGVKLVRIDEDMAREAVRMGRRIGVIATLRTTMEPTKRLLMDCAREMGREVELVEGLADGAFGLNEEQFTRTLIETGRKIRGKVDLLLFAQGSMAYAEQAVAEELGLPVLSSIRFGTAEARRMADELAGEGVD